MAKFTIRPSNGGNTQDDGLKDLIATRLRAAAMKPPAAQIVKQAIPAPKPKNAAEQPIDRPEDPKKDPNRPWLLPTEAPAPKRVFNPQTMCGAQLRRKERGRMCYHPKGFRTPHPGSGRCYLHGGCTPIRHGLASLITHHRLQDVVTKIRELDHAMMDLSPEVELMRALTIDFINRYDEFVENLSAWYDNQDDERAKKKLPKVFRDIPKLEEAAGLLEGISRVAERAHKITREGSITLDVFRAVMTQIGLVVARYVENTDILAAIEKDWSVIMVDPRSFIRGGNGNVNPFPDADEMEVGRGHEGTPTFPIRTFIDDGTREEEEPTTTDDVTEE